MGGRALRDGVWASRWAGALVNSSSLPGASVPDPYYGGDDDFDDVVRICLAACTPLLERLRREHRL